MGLVMNSINSDIIMDVIERIRSSHVNKSASPQETQSYISDALKSLHPFDAEDWVKDMLNNFLLEQQSDRVGCLATWALYKDYYTIRANETANG